MCTFFNLNLILLKSNSVFHLVALTAPLTLTLQRTVKLLKALKNSLSHSIALLVDSRSQTLSLSERAHTLKRSNAVCSTVRETESDCGRERGSSAFALFVFDETTQPVCSFCL